MTWNELREKCRRQSDYIITLFITNEVSLALTWILAKTRITPNQVTIASILCGIGCGLCYAFNQFIVGSLLLFSSHVLDCTDGNLARVKEMFSPLGKWLDMFGDRFAEAVIFIGVSIYFFRTGAQEIWILLTLIDAILLALYYYIVDIALAMGLAKPLQNIGGLIFKNVRIKWGVMEPVIYGFVVTAPLGLIKVQIVFIFLLIMTGLCYQISKKLLPAKT